MAYSEKVIEHYEKPRNVGTFGTQKEIKERKDIGVGLVGAPECGDVMQLQIKVDDDGKIEDAKFKCFGCGSAIASSSTAHATRSPIAKRRALKSCFGGRQKSVNQRAPARCPKQTSARQMSWSSFGTEIKRAPGGSTLTTYGSFGPVGPSGSSWLTAAMMPLAHLRWPPTLQTTLSARRKRVGFARSAMY